ncbi:MAG: CPBP family intramembrane metalloprotease [Sorangiineae bacterium]|nr:CPBP family intramembrane metalloprotease [Polyangiaceae bacterium]MEB2321547.1 CPBP family intramembrane metalloprotease [Sorangiineae bacterium]
MSAEEDPSQRGAPGPGGVLRLALLALLWPTLYLLLARYGVLALPVSLARRLDLQSYLTLVQLTTVGLGLLLAGALMGGVRAPLGLGRASPLGLACAALLAPALYVASSMLAIELALPTLLDELARGGTELAERSTGELGRSLVATPAALVLLWGAVVSPISEELMFRGAVWSAVQRLVRWLTGRGRGGERSPAPSWLEPGPLLRVSRAAGRFLRDGGVATLASAALFAWMHADRPGGLGIVRVASAAGLGVGCGLARQWSGSLLAALALHVSYNTLSIATTRRWVVTEGFPLRRGIPTLLELVALVGLALAGGLCLAVMRQRRAGRSLLR